MVRDSNKVLKILVILTVGLAILTTLLPKGVVERTTVFCILPPFKSKVRPGEVNDVRVKVSDHEGFERLRIVATLNGTRIFDENFTLRKGESKVFDIRFRVNRSGLYLLRIYLIRNGRVYRRLRLWLTSS